MERKLSKKSVIYPFLCVSFLKLPFWFSSKSLVAQMVKHLPTMRETRVQSLGWEDPLEKVMATHSSTLAWKIPWMEEYGRLRSMGSQRVGQDWATSHSLFWLPFSLRPFLGSFFIKPLVWGLSHFSIHFATEVIILTVLLFYPHAIISCHNPALLSI